MNFDLSDEQVMLREQAEKLFSDGASPARLRTLLDEQAPQDNELWAQLAELGFLGAAIPEEFGGLGMTPLDLGMIVEEAGRACAPVPIFSSLCLAAQALLLAGTAEQKQTWLPRLADGSVVGSFAHVEGPGPVLDATVATVVSDGRLNGVKLPVSDGGIAQLLIVVARDDAGDPALVLVETAQEGVTREAVSTIDELRHHARIRFTDAACEIMSCGAAASDALDRIYDFAATLAAFEAVGGAERCLFMGRDYALERKVFSRPIGSYQSIKHRLADMLALVEVARSNAWFAAWALLNDAEEAPAAAAAARLSAIEAYEFASRENLQIHGGIGYTWEADCHFYYRRSRLLAASLGNASEWSDRLVARIRGSILAAAQG